MKSILITGGTGFIGRALVGLLIERGYQVCVLTRDPGKAERNLPAGVSLIDNLGALNGSVPDVLVNLAGEPLAGRRWSSASKQLFRESRVEFTNKLFAFFAGRGDYPARVISGSAIGYYGNCGDRLIDEREASGGDFAAELCRDWELAAKQFEAVGSSLCLLRTGIVLGPEGGALKQMLPAFKFGLGGPMGSGGQFMSWIHLHDMVRLILFLIERPAIVGPINAVSSQSITNRDFSVTLAGAVRRPALIRVPAFVLMLMLGEMAKTLLLSSQRVLPTRALASGFEFRYPQLAGALEEMLKK
ncbi:TIGR01777 family protein [Cellvibrio sp. KY-GH-1]|uniref:TIGR01777 family oxidoreductase n=1 Tax=Cellvibrio sp. KY-GH-1 TaxID=2303332 RepID=UPI00124488A1|nr:TIGR01777 family oxidoreductase [Cellvibrio sp. KY-GH-1]QEY14627.1 TIGR01777 family protein [Cellvibrio sp. KY-GH-1]